METRFKIFSDPVHGFISVPKRLLLDLVQTPEVQRLRRIRQLGVGYLVFSGAEHTRFGHALGAMALMQDALATICEKGTEVTPDEHTAALAAALLHDIGHGPFSHSLEHEFIRDFQHEDMSRVLMVRLNERFGGALDLALRIFDGTYERPFFHQLVSSQLDMDRLDYLRRDSFYTGVVEGAVGVQRIIKTLRVHPAEGGRESCIVAESKGVYAVENYLIARRLMYGQVYLHKTVLAGDHLLQAIFRRVRRLVEAGNVKAMDAGAPSLLYFLSRTISRENLGDAEAIDAFCDLDDTDVLYSLKRWTRSADEVLADLSRRFINRDFFRVSFLPSVPTEEDQRRWKAKIGERFAQIGISTPSTMAEDAAYYIAVDSISHSSYEPTHEGIRIIDRSGKVRELTEVGDTAVIAAMSGTLTRSYVCLPREVSVG